MLAPSLQFKRFLDLARNDRKKCVQSVSSTPDTLDAGFRRDGPKNFLKLFAGNLERKRHMKTPRFQISIVMAGAIGTTVLIVSSTHADPLRGFRRLRSSERDATIPASSNLEAGKVHQPAPQVPSPARYPRYRLVDLGTLGGPNAGVWGNSAQLNNRGEVLAQLGTAVPDPDCLNFDCYVWHGVVVKTNGIVTDLGALPGENNSALVCITDNGLIAGLAENGLIDPLTDFPEFRAVLWDRNRSIMDLGTLGGNSSMGLATNSRGQVVGVALNATAENPDFATFINLGFPAATETRAFLWQNGSMQDLGTLGGNDAAASSINPHGQIAGYSFTNTTPNDTTGIPTVHPFLWNNGTMRDLGTLGGTLSVPGTFNGTPGGEVLNNSGEVAGTSTLAGDELWHAFVRSNGRTIDLGTLGGSTSDAVAINNKGQVVGKAVVTDTPFVLHGFLWENGHMTDLGAVAPCTRSVSNSINSANQIVGNLGYCTDDPNDITFYSAFYTEKGKAMVDLNTLITPASDVHLTDAWNINNRGEILANGKLPDGSGRVALLVPIPPGR
jgi:probable HAF family extracellular repeat protein